MSKYAFTLHSSRSASATLMLFVLFTTLVLSFGILAPLPAYAATGIGLPGDPNIHYVGRWDTTSSATTYTSNWGGAYLKTAFTGVTVQIKLGATTTIAVSIDNNTDVYYTNVSGTVNLTATPLTAGTHQLRVAARGWTDSIAFQGLTLDASATTAPPTTSPQLIEFVGDSITAGYDDTNAALSDYAWLTGEQLHSEHTQIAYPGICLVDAVHCYSPNAIGMSRQFFKLQTVDYPNSPTWDFSRYQAGAVVINLGTNDNSKGVSDATFQSTYVSFIQSVRAKYPKAAIFALRTFGGFKAAPTQAAVSAVNAAGDNHVYFIDTTGWLTSADYVSDGIHPSDAGQAKVARQLAPVLAPYVGATSAATVDDSVQGSAANQFTYIGTWGHCNPCGGDNAVPALYAGSDSWSNTTNDQVALTFTGAQVAFYGVKAPNHGIGAISVDGGSATMLDFYAAARAGDQLLWNSPVLVPGRHTLTLRVTGAKDAASLGAYVTVDRVDIMTSSYYKLVNRNSGKLLDVAGGSLSDGGGVIQYADHNTPNQQWQILPNGGYDKLVNRNSGKVLDVPGSSTTAGQQLDQNTDSGDANQQWQFSGDAGGVYTVANRNSAMLVDVAGQATADGAKVVQWPTNGGANQQWQLVPAT